MQFEAAIFDLDGTLVDTLEDLADAMNRVLVSEQLPVHDYVAYRHMIGGGIPQLVRLALPAERRSDETIERGTALMMAEYSAHCLVKTHPYEGVIEMLGRLRGDGVESAVLSNKSDELVQRIVDALIGPRAFAVVAGAQTGIPLKPDPAGALLVADGLRVARERIVYVGDSGVDMLTATRAGMLAVGVSWGFRARDELLAAGALTVLDKPLELLAWRAEAGR
jgi:phosphoglycolate phosphatase